VRADGWKAGRHSRPRLRRAVALHCDDASSPGLQGSRAASRGGNEGKKSSNRHRNERVSTPLQKKKCTVGPRLIKGFDPKCDDLQGRVPGSLASSKEDLVWEDATTTSWRQPPRWLAVTAVWTAPRWPPPRWRGSNGGGHRRASARSGSRPRGRLARVPRKHRGVPLGARPSCALEGGQIAGYTIFRRIPVEFDFGNSTRRKYLTRLSAPRA
jgi:hypothetical protein